jgi:hypothetical protein
MSSGITIEGSQANFTTRTTTSFWSAMFHEPMYRRFLIIATIACISQFVIFKLLYPFPDFISDSYSYIDTNLYHMKVNLWPIGYSLYLQLIHQLTSSDTFLVLTQYIFLQLSLQYFFFSFTYLYKISQRNTTILFLFLFFNPAFLYISNCILSDSVFCAISIVWFTQFLWMYRKPATRQIVIQSILIGIAFTIRYTAIYYPIVMIFGYMLSRNRIGNKVLGIVLPWVFILPFIFYTKQKTKEITGTAQFSVFGGWQLANNALYMYDHIKVDSTQLPPGSVELDNLVRSFYKRVPKDYRDFQSFPGTYFIKIPYAVLKPYMFKHCTFSDAPGQFLAWGTVSPLYVSYGKYLILHNTFAFARYYLWLNVKNYFIPHLEKFGSYNLGSDRMQYAAQYWFNLKSAAVHAQMPELQEHLFFFLPAFFMMLNIYFMFSLMWLFFNGGLKMDSLYFRPILLFVIFIIINFCFSVFATPIVFRYQLVPMMLLFSFSILINERLDQVKNNRA